jgi:hypothetical protein
MLQSVDKWPREEAVEQVYRLKGVRRGKSVAERSLANLHEAVNKSIKDHNKI